MIIYIFLIVVDEVLLIENCSFFSFLFMFTLNKHLKPVVYEVCVCVCKSYVLLVPSFPYFMNVTIKVYKNDIIILM